VALLRLRLGEARALWILDEPFSSLDSQAAESLVGWIDAHLAQGGMVVYTTHEEIALRARMLELGSPC
jgi:heme exporter protein A